MLVSRNAVHPPIQLSNIWRLSILCPAREPPNSIRLPAEEKRQCSLHPDVDPETSGIRSSNRHSPSAMMDYPRQNLPCDARKYESREQSK